MAGEILRKNFQKRDATARPFSFPKTSISRLEWFVIGTWISSQLQYPYLARSSQVTSLSEVSSSR